ncbi:zinc ribbon domain-containing protein [bacterium]|nr:zinc ribbon domain-containing protein [bacterium]RQV97967.1 MAG: zinc ribbon domain-containing protein [bacterium]
MPVYTYICNECGEKFDLLVGVTAQQEALKCKKCGSKNIKKAIGSFNVGTGGGRSGGSGSSCPTGTCPLA